MKFRMALFCSWALRLRDAKIQTGCTSAYECSAVRAWLDGADTVSARLPSASSKTATPRQKKLQPDEEAVVRRVLEKVFDLTLCESSEGP